MLLQQVDYPVFALETARERIIATGERTPSRGLCHQKNGVQPWLRITYHAGHDHPSMNRRSLRGAVDLAGNQSWQGTPHGCRIPGRGSTRQMDLLLILGPAKLGGYDISQIGECVHIIHVYTYLHAHSYA